jgi:hypothetical protein
VTAAPTSTAAAYALNTAKPVHGDSRWPVDLDRRPLLAQQPAQAIMLRGADPDEAHGAGAHERVHGRVGDQPAPPDDDQVVRGQRQLAHQMAGHEHGAALARQRPQQGADPRDTLGIESVDRLVQQQHPRVAEQGGDSQALGHAERKLAGPPAGRRVQADQTEHLVDPAPANAVGLSQRQQVSPGATPGMDGGGLQHRPTSNNGRRSIR